MRFRFARPILGLALLGLLSASAWSYVAAAPVQSNPPCDRLFNLGHAGFIKPTDSIEKRKFEHGPLNQFLSFWGTFRYRFKCHSDPLTQGYQCKWCVAMSWERVDSQGTVVLWSHTKEETLGCSTKLAYEYVSSVMAHDAQGINSGSHYAKIEMHPGPCPLNTNTNGYKMYMVHLGDVP